MIELVNDKEYLDELLEFACDPNNKHNLWIISAVPYILRSVPIYYTAQSKILPLFFYQQKLIDAILTLNHNDIRNSSILISETLKHLTETLYPIWQESQNPETSLDHNLITRVTDFIYNICKMITN
jgi:hypothetical protein